MHDNPLVTLVIVVVLFGLFLMYLRRRHWQVNTDLSGYDPYARMAAEVRPGIHLTRRDLEHINIQRRVKGRLPLNANGFSRAIAVASWTQPRDTGTAQWFTYLIAWQVSDIDYTSTRTAVDTDLHIDPEQPFNGHRGTFGGAGASGGWDAGTTTDPAPAAAAAALGPGLMAPPPQTDPETSRNDYGTGVVQDSPVPTYDPPSTDVSNVVDPGPSFTPDTSSSVTVDTGSFDTGS